MAKISFSEVTSTSFKAKLLNDNGTQITTGSFMWSGDGGPGTGFEHTFIPERTLTPDTLYVITCAHSENGYDNWVEYNGSVRTLSDGGGITPPPSGGDDFNVTLTQGTTTSTSLIAQVSANLPIYQISWYLDDFYIKGETYNGAFNATYVFSNLQPNTGYMITAEVTSTTGKTVTQWGFFTTNSASTNTPIQLYFYPDPNDQSYGFITVKNVLGQELQSGATFYSNDSDWARTVTATATVRAGYKFIGWYGNNSFLSNSTTYSFIIPNNITSYILIGKFSDDTSTSDKPKEFQWDTEKIKGMKFNLSASEWNAFQNKIEEVAQYALGLNQPVSYFTDVSSGSEFKASYFNDAAYYINLLYKNFINGDWEDIKWEYKPGDAIQAGDKNIPNKTNPGLNDLVYYLNNFIKTYKKT